MDVVHCIGLAWFRHAMLSSRILHILMVQEGQLLLVVSFNLLVEMGDMNYLASLSFDL